MDFASEIRLALAEEIGQERFDLWFDDVALEICDDKMRVAAKTEFLLNRLKRDFQQPLRTAGARLGFAELEIDFAVAPTSTVSRPSKHENTSSVGHVTASGASQVNVAARTETRKCSLIRAASQPVRRSRFRTFDSFIDGECNRLVRTSVEMVANQPGEITPLVIHGPTGVGKTHLLEAVWCQVRKNRRVRIIYLTAEQFTTYFIEALKGNGLPTFRRKYRQADVLMIDDIQFFAKKQATLVELAYTIDELSRENRQLILAADRPPAQLASSLGRDIANRLSGGLVCSIKPIDQATMESISAKWAVDRNIPISPEIHSNIAARMQGDARQLAGILNRLQATSAALRQPVTQRMVNEVLYELVPSQARVIRLQDVRKAVCEVFGLEANNLQQQSRSRAITRPRMLAMYLARKHTSAGLHEISQFFGRRSHSSAVTASSTVDAWLTNGEVMNISGQTCDVRDIVSQIERSLRAG